jgi:hypothetical protein
LKYNEIISFPASYLFSSELLLLVCLM